MNAKGRSGADRRLLSLGGSLLLVGVALGAAALVTSPEFAAEHLSEDGRISADALAWLAFYRRAAGALAAVLAAGGLAVVALHRRLRSRWPGLADLPARLGLALASLLVAFGAAEVAVRLAADPTSGDVAAYSRTFQRSVRGQLNARGFRDASFDALDPAVRILVIGDSMVFGFGLENADDAFPAALENELAARFPAAPIDVLNAGKPGVDTRDEIRNLASLLPVVDPDVVVLGYCLNDIQSVAEKRAFFRARRLIPLISDNLSRLSLAWRRFEDAVTRALERTSLRTSHFESLAAGFAEGSERFASHRRELARLLDLAGRDGRRVAVVIFPFVEGFEPYPFEDAHRRLDATFAELQAPCLDLLTVFRGESAADFQVSPLDHHLNAEGARRAARATAEFLIEQGLLPPSADAPR